jgi:hypothetical protein
MDTKLLWKPCINEIQRQVTSTIGALCSLGNLVWGARMLEMRKLNRGVAIPRMMRCTPARFGHKVERWVPDLEPASEFCGKDVLNQNSRARDLAILRR